MQKTLLMAALTSLLGACTSVRYYAQAVRGQSELVLHRRTLSSIINDPRTSVRLAARLKLALAARTFASLHLKLPDNRSYTRYVDLHRPYVVWNVFAAPKFSIKAVPQCFPVAGCVAYRGYFKEADAERDAAGQRQAGNDVWVGGVPAYSTLGWFDDPILSSMLRWDDDELDSTIFHELAHQLIYVKGDTAFNESFATFVQREGLREWRRSRGLPPQRDRAEAMDRGFTTLVLDLRHRLGRLYASDEDAEAMAAGKKGAIEAFRQRYRAWQQHEWPDDHRYDAWVARPINNARLLPFGLYDAWTPAFAHLFEQAGRNWTAFYASVDKLAHASKAQRDGELSRLAKAVTARSPPVGAP